MLAKKIILFFILLLCGVIILTQAAFSGARSQGNTLLLYNCTVIDGNSTVPLTNKCIFIREGKIEKITDSKAPADFLAANRVMNLQGFTVMPGLINAHVHAAYDEAKLHEWLLAGVTSVADLSARNLENFTEIRDKLNRNPANARLISATPIITADKGGYGWIPVRSSPEAVEVVNSYINQKADIIKIAFEDDIMGRKWPLLSEDKAIAIVQTAHAKQVKVTAHVTRSWNLPLALQAGVDQIAHMVIDPLDDCVIDEVVKRDVYWIPTLELWQGVLKPDKFDTVLDNLTRFYKAGGRIALGTDYAGAAIPFEGGLPKKEIALMQKAGMSTMDILIAATKNAAHASGVGESVGTLGPGKVADIIVTRSNPLEGLDALQNLVLVIHNGQIVFEK